MNKKIQKYVNYLIDNNPSPFCDYIICKELLALDDKTIRDSYEWAKRFKLYTEIQDEQLPDGSWGGFDTAHTELTKKSHYKATARAIERILDLSLDASDPMTAKTIEVMKKYLSGELPDPEHYGKDNTGKPISIRRMIIQNLGYFEPENAYVAELRGYIAECFRKSCTSGSFVMEAWCSQGDVSIWNWHLITMLSGGVIDDELQRILLAHECNSSSFGVWAKPSEFKQPEEKEFAFWIRSVERLQHFTLFGEFMEKDVTPYLYSLCERIINDEHNEINIATNNYFYHRGQYTESLRNKQHKKNDLLLRIIRILNKCN